MKLHAEVEIVNRSLATHNMKVTQQASLNHTMKLQAEVEIVNRSVATQNMNVTQHSNRLV